MNETQIEKINNTFKKGWSKKDCPVCANKNWAMSNQIVALPSFSKKSDEAYPVVPISCDNCGYTEIISAKFAGIVD